jgi:hypothetical protein
MTLLSRARANVVGTAFSRVRTDIGFYYYTYSASEAPEGDAPEGPPDDDAAHGA